MEICGCTERCLEKYVCRRIGRYTSATRKLRLMRNGWDASCQAKSNFTGRRMELRKEKWNEVIPGEKNHRTRAGAILILTVGIRRLSEHMRPGRAHSGCRTWWATVGNGRERCLGRFKDLRRCPFIQLIRRTFSMGNIM